MAVIGHAILVTAVLPANVRAQAGSELPATDRVITLDARPAYTVGGRDAAPWAQFGRVEHVRFDARGRLYILDPLGLAVIVVDDRGQHVRTLGREGRGPGEFTSPESLAVFDDGSVTVNDRLRRAFVAFDSAGTLRTDSRPSRARGEPTGVHPLPDGRLAAAAMVWLLDGVPHVRTGSDFEPTTRRDVLLFSADGATVSRVTDAYLAVESERARDMTVPIAFQPKLWLSVTRDGRLVLVDSSTYRIRVLRPGRDTREIRRELRPRAVSDRDRRAERSRRLAILNAPGARVTGASMGGSVDRQQVLERQRQAIAAMRFADVMPVIARASTDWSGRIWVQRTGDAGDRTGPIDIVTADGEYIGTLAEGTPFPDAFGPGGRVAYIREDELGVQRVEVVRIGR